MNIENTLIKMYNPEIGVYYYNVFTIPQELKDLPWLKNCEQLVIIVNGEKGTAEYNENILIVNYVMKDLKEFFRDAIYHMINDHHIDITTYFSGNIGIIFNSANNVDFEITFEKTTAGLFRKKTFQYFFDARFQRSNNRQINFQKITYYIGENKS